MLQYMSSWPFNPLLDAYRNTQLETSGRSLSNMTHAASPKNLRQMCSMVCVATENAQCSCIISLLLYIINLTTGYLL